MEEVTIKITLKEANVLRFLLKNEIKERAIINDFLKAMGGKAPDFVEKQSLVYANLCDKIDAAINAS